jgi:hypothetical protein
MPMTTPITVASTPSTVASSVSPEYDRLVSLGAERRRADEARIESLRQLDASERHYRGLLDQCYGRLALPTVVTITAGDHVRGVAMSPTRAAQLLEDVRQLLETTFTIGWLDGEYEHKDGTRVSERSLVGVGITTIDLHSLKAHLSSIARQYEQEALGLMIAHGGGINSLIEA